MDEWNANGLILIEWSHVFIDRQVRKFSPIVMTWGVCMG